MEFDPLKLANSMRESYAEHYAGSQPHRAVKNLVSRYNDGSGESLDSDLPESSSVQKGLTCKSLISPNKRHPWETFGNNHGLHEDVIKTFSEAGFRSLFEFQESAVESVLEDHHTLLTAATGRGKPKVGSFPFFSSLPRRRKASTLTTHQIVSSAFSRTQRRHWHRIS